MEEAATAGTFGTTDQLVILSALLVENAARAAFSRAEHFRLQVGQANLDRVERCPPALPFGYGSLVFVNRCATEDIGEISPFAGKSEPIIMSMGGEAVQRFRVPKIPGQRHAQGHLRPICRQGLPDPFLDASSLQQAALQHINLYRNLKVSQQWMTSE
jgi:hypothetical protein